MRLSVCQIADNGAQGKMHGFACDQIPIAGSYPHGALLHAISCLARAGIPAAPEKGWRNAHDADRTFFTGPFSHQDDCVYGL